MNKIATCNIYQFIFKHLFLRAMWSYTSLSSHISVHKEPGSSYSSLLVGGKLHKWWNSAVGFSLFCSPSISLIFSFSFQSKQTVFSVKIRPLLETKQTENLLKRPDSFDWFIGGTENQSWGFSFVIPIVFNSLFFSSLVQNINFKITRKGVKI